jgi:Zn-finger nucleic acid-binding protein
MIFLGAKFCSHCGARADRSESPGGVKQLCPRCRVDLQQVKTGNVTLLECPGCDGIWTDAESLQQICAEREQQAAVLGMFPTHEEIVDPEKKIRYLPCPVCHKLMNRVNFAHCSQVIVDVCKQHGTWFDRDEMRRTVEFIRAGGLEKARARELAGIEEERRRLAIAENGGLGVSSTVLWESDGDHVKRGDSVINEIAELLRSLLRS